MWKIRVRKVLPQPCNAHHIAQGGCESGSSRKYCQQQANPAHRVEKKISLCCSVKRTLRNRLQRKWEEYDKSEFRTSTAAWAGQWHERRGLKWWRLLWADELGLWRVAVDVVWCYCVQLKGPAVRAEWEERQRWTLSSCWGLKIRPQTESLTKDTSLTCLLLLMSLTQDRKSKFNSLKTSVTKNIPT